MKRLNICLLLFFIPIWLMAQVDTAEKDIEFETQDFDEEEIIDVELVEVNEEPVTAPIGQEEDFFKETDDFYIKETMVNDSSLLYLQSKEKGYHLIDVRSNCCQPAENMKLKTRILSLNYQNDTLSVAVTFLDNCGAKFFCEIEVKNDTLNFIEANKSGGYALCTCEFILEYDIIVAADEVSHFQLNGQKIVQTDQKYKEERRVKTTYPNGNRKSMINYWDDQKMSEFHWYESGHKEIIVIYREGKVSYKEFFDEEGETVKIIKYENGKEIEEKLFHDNK